MTEAESFVEAIVVAATLATISSLVFHFYTGSAAESLFVMLIVFVMFYLDFAPTSSADREQTTLSEFEEVEQR